VTTPSRPAQAGQNSAQVITGVAAMITAIGGTVGVLYQTGVIGHRQASPVPSPTPAASASPSPGATASPSPSPSTSPGSADTPTPSPEATSTPEPSASPTPAPSHGIIIR
jgi:hypothetical protein